jgi:hypothetical protein
MPPRTGQSLPRSGGVIRRRRSLALNTQWKQEQDRRAIQPSLRDLSNSASYPALKTPGYYHDVPSGQTVFAGRLQEFFSAAFMCVRKLTVEYYRQKL